MVKYFKYIALFLPIAYQVFPQVSKISEKEAELASVKNEIRKLEDELIKRSSAEKKSFEAVENLSKQGHLLNKVIGALKNGIKEKQTEIKRTEGRIKSLENEINILKTNYANYVVALYKKGPYNELEALVDASSLQQAVLRIHYLQEFSEKRSRDLSKLKLRKKELAEVKNVLISEKKEEDDLMKAKEGETKILTVKLKERKKILTSIQNDSDELRKLLAAKKESRKRIEELIVELIEAEKKRLAGLEKEKIIEPEVKTRGIEEEHSGTEYELDTSTLSSFSELKGRMIWPVQKGKIIRKFGENKNKKLNTVTLNYGVDIKAGSDKNVRCVGEGIISAIDWLPGYGNVIIVSHRDDYRTVYSHLSEIYISEGERVKSGSVLAKVDETFEGEILHFEIWQAREKQDPELWLAKK